MAEAPRLLHDKPMCVRIWLEVGHACEPRFTTHGSALALDWRVWVRGVCGRDISCFVQKVAFDLPQAAFVHPRKVFLEPPYEVKESGCASFDIPVDLYLKYCNKPQKMSLRYSLQIKENSRCNSESRCVYFDLVNPSEQLRSALMSVGGEVMPHMGAPDTSKDLVVVPSHEERRDHLKKPKKVIVPSHNERRDHLKKPKKVRFAEPLPCKHGRKRRTCPYRYKEEICKKCGVSDYAELNKQLRSVA